MEKMQSVCFNGVNFVNLTPHAITIIISDSKQLTIPASGLIARVSQIEEILPPIAGIPVIRATLGEVEGLPSPIKGTVYIVSALTAGAISGRDDVYVPGDLIRDTDGQPVGCRGLKKI